MDTKERKMISATAADHASPFNPTGGRLKRRPFIVGIGGTCRMRSSSEQALEWALHCAERRGARVELIGGHKLMLPLYDPEKGASTKDAEQLIAAVRQADGLIFSTPCYHGALSGMIKNAIDYLEETRGDPRKYLDGVSVGIISSGAGSQAPGMVLTEFRTIVHALRGWPTPLGVAINSSVTTFKDGICSDKVTADQLDIMAGQVYDSTVARAKPELLSSVAL